MSLFPIYFDFVVRVRGEGDEFDFSPHFRDFVSQRTTVTDKIQTKKQQLAPYFRTHRAPPCSKIDVFHEMFRLSSHQCSNNHHQQHNNTIN